MNYKQRFLRILETRGTAVTLHKDEDFCYKAFVYPVKNRNKYYLEENRLPVGAMDNRYSIYISADRNGGELLCEGDILTFGESRYVVKKREQVMLGDEIFYIWAILAGAREDAL